MSVVSDTSPLNYLVRIGRQDVLESLYGEVKIPYAVQRELLHPQAPAAVYSWIRNPPSWLTIEGVRAFPALPVLGLDAGETEAILLAENLSADLLMDDDAGKKLARARRLIVTGTLGVLRSAARRNLLDLASSVRHVRDAGLYVTEALVADVLHDR